MFRMFRHVTGVSLFIAVMVGSSVLALAPPHDASATPPIGCESCHSLHGFGLILRDSEQETLCKTCHNPSGQAPDMSDVALHSVLSDTVIVDCGSCHDPHSPSESYNSHTDTTTTNLSLIRDDTATYWPDALEPSVFHTDPDDFAYTTTPFNGICQTCHTATSYHTNTGDNTGHGSADCVSCHPHGDGFAGSGGSCMDCHGSAQDNGDGIPSWQTGRRAIVGELSYASHHLQGLPLDDSDCSVCHEMTQHQAGYVRLLDVDTTTLVATLTGDPASDATEAAKLTDFCLACHDSDGANGSAPFTNGSTPVDIDLTQWTGSSHNNYPLTCYGDGVFGCHSSGHGSKKQKLLAPFETAPTSPENEEEEEGFCFNCHDSDGPAASDIAAFYNQPIRWATGPINKTMKDLNDRHDVQYAAQVDSGAIIECTDCHNPHTATSADPLVADPDPNDGNTPTTRSEWCLDCHDGSFPPSVTAPTIALIDVSGTIAGDAMGNGSGNASLKSGYGWGSGDNVPCEACHHQHPDASTTSWNLFQGVDLVKSKDGTTNIPSDGAGLIYEMTDNNVVNRPINGYEWCNTCHTNSMGTSKANCFSCHYHGRRW